MIKKLLVAGTAVGVLAALWPVLGPLGGTVASPIVVGRVHRDFHPRDGKLFFLVIGNDARAGNPDASRADAIHIVGVNTVTKRGGILNFPRDSWVSIPGSGQGRINEALYRGGPGLLASTLESITGIRLDYWIMTGFEGFQGIVQGLNGVEMAVQKDLYDPTGSGAQIDAGYQNLGPKDSLAYVRTRHNFPNGDVDRTTNQGRFLLAMLKKLRREVTRSPAALLRWITIGRRYTRLDISPKETFRLAVLATQFSARDMGNETVPVTVGSVGAASVVFISPGAQSIYARFRSTAAL